MDVFEDPVTNRVTATFELPGVSRDKIAIDVYDNRLTISGEVASFFDENYGYILRERRTGPFVRALALPANIPVSH
jgi:HSP20 family protein